MKLPMLALFGLLSTASLYAWGGDVAKVGQMAPSFTGVATDGTEVSLESYSGKVVLLDFFATWCGPCMQEMPLIEKDVWQQYRPAGLAVIAIGREHGAQELADFKANKHYTFRILGDPNRNIYKKYATEYIPRCYVIGKDGIIKFASTGYQPDEFEKMKAVISAELSK